MSFNVRKAAQVVAFFIRERGGELYVIEATKLVYLADRNFMAKFDEPLLYDELSSMEHGPVDSETYNLIKGDSTSTKLKQWREFVRRRDGNILRLTPSELHDADLDQLSRAEMRILRQTAEEMRDYEKFEFVKYVHKHCTEWKDPGRTSLPLPYERVFAALNKKNSAELAERVTEVRNLSDALTKAS